MSAWSGNALTYRRWIPDGYCITLHVTAICFFPPVSVNFYIEKRQNSTFQKGRRNISIELKYKIFCFFLPQQNEREHLLKERDQILSTLGETKQNLTGLCQKVCREAALSHEQIHILAKYSSSECPLSFLVPEKGKMVLQCEAILQEFTGGLINPGEASRRPSEEGNSVLQNAPSMAVKPPATALARQSAMAGGITDFCQQMTAKCTTDEQNQSWPWQGQLFI